MDDELPVSYQGVPLGVPVLTRDGEQFGILEHVLEVPEEDIFEGIVVWVAGGTWLDRRIQRELSMNHQEVARRLELFESHNLRFVEADTILAITAGYLRCDLAKSDVGLLPPPPHDAPVFYANAIDQTPPHDLYGRLFGRARWARGN